MSITKNNDELYNKALRETKDGVTMDVIVRPQSSHSKVVGFDNWRFRFEIKLTSIPTKGKANEELRKVIGLFFNLKQNDVEIISGHKSTQKKVLLKAITIENVLSTLEDKFK